MDVRPERLRRRYATAISSGGDDILCLADTTLAVLLFQTAQYI
jgi:hypothetical protein